MDRNLFLAFGLSLLVLLLWTMLFDPPSPPPEQYEPVQAERSPEMAPAPALQAPGLPELAPAPLVEKMPLAAEPNAVPTTSGQRLAFETELYRGELDTRGAGIAFWELKDYRTSKREGKTPVILTTGIAPFQLGLATPFGELGLGDLSSVEFSVENPLPLEYIFRYSQDGVSVEKTFVFHEDTYAFDLAIRVENNSEREIVPRFAVSWPASQQPGNDFREQALAAVIDGSVESELLQGIGEPGFFGGGERERVLEGSVDWIGSQSSYFVSALLPDQPAQAKGRFVATTPGVAGVAQVFFDPVRLPPGQPAERVVRGYIGPKERVRLEQVGGELVRSIDLGWAWISPLTTFFGWLLAALHVFIPNYGLAIIVLTVLVRVVTTPLTTKQMRSMERMRKLQPKLTELKEKYPDDRQKQSEEMMRLYKNEGVNPLGGCLPMLLQLPVFIGLFYALRSSIQLRQAPFFGWIDDLAAPDSLFEIPGIGIPLRVLPLIMGATMVFQQRITPMQGMDPAQQKMIQTMMPIMMTVVFYQFPSGLVLYWMVSNVLAIAHQLWIGKHIK